MSKKAETARESLPRRQTDPLWLHHPYLAKGHDATTRNATATFIRRKGRHFMVTCRHVLEMVVEARTGSGREHLTMALHVGRTILNMAHASPTGVELSVRAPGGEYEAGQVDIALAPLAEWHWELLRKKKGKVAIDLDSWREPDWSTVEYCLAAGYPDEGKYPTSEDGAEMVAAPILNVVAELCSDPARGGSGFTMMSQLASPPGASFSGMSGGAVYTYEGQERRKVEDEEVFPVGIVYGGFPGANRASEPSEEASRDAFLTERDIMIRALKLTPDVFDDWVRRCGF